MRLAHALFRLGSGILLLAVGLAVIMLLALIGERIVTALWDILNPDAQVYTKWVVFWGLCAVCVAVMLAAAWSVGARSDRHR